MSLNEELKRTIEQMDSLMTWHLAAPLVDHDGGDEDDRLFQERGFLRAVRKPRSKWFRQGDRLFVLQEPELLAVPPRFEDPGDVDDGYRWKP